MVNGMWMRQGSYNATFVASPYGPAEWQLFDLSEDPGETRDLAKDRPKLLKELKSAWDQYAKDVGVTLGKK